MCQGWRILSRDRVIAVALMEALPGDDTADTARHWAVSLLQREHLEILRMTLEVNYPLVRPGS